MVRVKFFVKEFESCYDGSCMLRFGNVLKVISWEMLDLLLRNSLKDFMLVCETLRIKLIFFQLCFSFGPEMICSLKRFRRGVISKSLNISMQGKQSRIIDGSLADVGLKIIKERECELELVELGGNRLCLYLYFPIKCLHE